MGSDLKSHGVFLIVRSREGNFGALSACGDSFA